MVGLGEEPREVERPPRRPAHSGVEIVTIGQYLQPSRRNLPVARYVPPEQFDACASTPRARVPQVLSGPLVRSSYMARRRADHFARAGSAVLLISRFPDSTSRLWPRLALARFLVAVTLESARCGDFFSAGRRAPCTGVEPATGSVRARGHGKMACRSWGSFVLFCSLQGAALAVFALLAGAVMRRAWAIRRWRAMGRIERTHGTFGFAWQAWGTRAPT